jgi:3',5'-cyclic AMP phosphodiesterase CpdA
VVVGDTWKDTPIIRRVVADVKQRGDALIVALGDVTPQGYESQMAEFDRLIEQAGVAVYLAPGNHEYLNGGIAALQRYYPRHTSFDYGTAHFAIVDDGNYEMGKDELAWLDNDLTATRQPLRFVFSHIPPEAPYGLPLGEDKLLKAGASEFSAILAQRSVNILFAAHLHGYVQYHGEGNVQRIITGGGGEPLQIPRWLGGYYNYVRVTVQGNTATTQVVEVGVK